MANEALVLEVGESGFERYVIENSHKLPVLVEFMGMWSEPCVVMSDVMHDLANEFAGQFVFAKVDIDEQPALAKQYAIENVPTLLVFKDGETTFTQEGQLQEAELRVLLKGLGVFHQSDELREQAREKHMAGETGEAIVLLSQAIKMDPANTRVAMDMVQIFIDIGEMEQAKGLFNRLPDRDKESSMGKSLIGQLTFADLAAKTDGVERLQERLAQNPADLDARFDLALCLVAGDNYNGAIDQLFSLLESERDYKEGAAKEMVITITNMLAPNDAENAAAYRQRLANILNG
jgi:putative thioredoxin